MPNSTYTLNNIMGFEKMKHPNIKVFQQQWYFP